MCGTCQSNLWAGRLPKAHHYRALEKPTSHHQKSKSDAHTIFHNGTIITMAHGKFSDVAAVVPKDDMITFCGSFHEANKHAGSNATYVDLKKHCLFPGVVDPHLHIFISVIVEPYVDLSPASFTSLDDCVTALKLAVKEEKFIGDWIIGYAYDPSLDVEHRDMLKEDLDDISLDHPVIVINQSLHIAYVNQKAIDVAGLPSAAVRDVYYIKDQNGEMTGVILEKAINNVLQHLPPVDPELLVRQTKAKIVEWAALGVTTIYDISIGANGAEEEPALLGQLFQTAAPPLRMLGAFLIDAFPDEKDFSSPPTQLGYLEVRGAKFSTDGSTSGFTAAYYDEYLNKPGTEVSGPENRGNLNYPNEWLQTKMRARHEEGWQLCVHANGDRAIDQTLDAYEYALRGEGTRKTPGLSRIEHFAMPNPDQIKRAARLEIATSNTFCHIWRWGETFTNYVLGPTRVLKLVPLKTLEEEGIVFSLNADPPYALIDPWLMVRTAVTRLTEQTGIELGVSGEISELTWRQP